MTRARAGRTVREVLLTSGAVVGALCIVVTLAGLAFGITPLVFRSGSMSPAIDTGALGLARTVDAAELDEGDIVSVTNAAGTRITHRIVGISGSEGARELTLQGDANDVTDPDPYVVTEADRVFFSVPLLGYVVTWLSGPIGLFLLGAYAMFLLSVLWRPGRDRNESEAPAGRRRAARGARSRRRRRGSGDDPPPGRRRAQTRSSAKVGATVVAVLVLGAGSAATTVIRTTDTQAAFTDTVPVTAGVTAYAVPAPASFTCTPGGVFTYRVTFSWPAVAGATSYTVHYGTGGASTATTTATTYTYNGPFLATTNGTAWVEANRNFGSTTWSSPATASLPYTTAFFSDC